MTDRYRVAASGLYLRESPVVAPSTKIALLPQGHVVEKLGESDFRWWRIRTNVQGSDVEGFVAAEYLVAAAAFEGPPAQDRVGAVHLTPKRLITRNQTTGRAYPLNETKQPSRAGDTPEARAESLGKIIDWLAVDTSGRYERTPDATFCNIYAYDYCYLAGVYLPRVWWTQKSVARLSRGEAVTPLPDSTVNELNANALYDWLDEWGDDFGWRRVFSLGEIQGAANAGGVGIVCGQRGNLNAPGHIVAVVPETKQQHALRQGGEVTAPLQSQAGSKNFRYGGGVWWTDSERFRKFGFWVHD